MKPNFSLFIIVIFLSSCGKKKDIEQVPEKPSQSSFINKSEGSFWTYKIRNFKSFNLDSSVTITATGGDTLINGRLYRIYTSSGGDQKYLDATTSDCYEYFRVPGTEFYMERLFLKTKLRQSEIWTQEAVLDPDNPSNSLKLSLQNEVRELGNVRLNETDYSNTYHILTKGTITSPSGSNVGSLVFDNYYTTDYGLLYNATVLGFDYQGLKVSVDVQLTMTSANLKY